MDFLILFSVDAEQLREAEREKNNVWVRERKSLRRRGVVGSGQGRRGRAKEYECVLNCASVCFPPYTCGTYESLFLPWNRKYKR